MNNNLRRILTAAACAAIMGGTGNMSYAVTADISSGTANATVDAGKGTLSADWIYEWGSSAGDESATVKLSGGTLNMESFSSSVRNGVIKATGGTLNVIDGTLTIDGSSYVDYATILKTSEYSQIDINGGTVHVGNDDSVAGAINLAAGKLTVENTKVGGDITVTAGAIITNAATLDGALTIQSDRQHSISGGVVNGLTKITGGEVDVAGTTFNDDVRVSGGDNEFQSVVMSSDLTLSGGDNEIFDSVIVKDLEVSGGSNYISGSSVGGRVLQTGGSTTVVGNFDVKNQGSKISGGTFNIGDGSDTTVDFKGEITSDVWTNINRNSTLKINDGAVSLDAADSWNGDVIISDGTLKLNGVQKDTNATFTQTGGYTTVAGNSSFTMNNAADIVSGGNLDIGTEFASGTLNVSRGKIESDAVVSVYEKGTLNVNGGSVALGSDDFWDGKVSISGGTLDLDDVNKNPKGIYTQSGGTTNLTGTLDLSSGKDVVSDGVLNIGSDAKAGHLIVDGAVINEAAEINLNSNSDIDIKKGTVSLDAEDDYSGSITNRGGTLNLNNVSKTGTIVQTNGTTNVKGKDFNLNNTADLFDGGNLNIGDGATSSELTVSKGKITDETRVTINDRGTLKVTGGDVSLGDDTVWEGDVEMSGGKLAIAGINKTGEYTQTAGATTVTGIDFDLNDIDDYIDGGSVTIGNGVTKAAMGVSEGAISKKTDVTISNNASLNVSGGSVELNKNTDWKGNVSLSDGRLTLEDVKKDPNATYSQTGGKAIVIGTGFDLDNAEDVVSGGVLNLGDKVTTTTLGVSQGRIDSAAVVNINKNATLDISGGSVELGKNDSWVGDVNISEGSLSLVGINKNSQGKFTQSGGSTKIKDSEFDLNNSEDNISGGKLDLTNSTLNVKDGNVGADAIVNLNSGSKINIEGGNVAMDNTDTWDGDISNIGGNLTIDGVIDKKGTITQKKGTTTVIGTEFNMNKAGDSFTGGTLDIGNGTDATAMKVTNGTIASNTAVNINENSSLQVNGGNVSLGSEGTWTGDVSVSAGNLTLAGKTKDVKGKFIQNAGTTTIIDTGFDMNNEYDVVSGGTLNVGDGVTYTEAEVSKGTIASDATVNINNNAALNISGGNVTLDGASDTYNGKVTISDGSLALVGINKNSSAVLKQTGGKTTIVGSNFDLNNVNDLIDGGTLELSSDETNELSTITVSKGTITKKTSFDLSQNNTMNISGGNVTLDGDTDSISGNINISSGNLTLDTIKKDESSVITQTGGTTSIVGSGGELNNEKDVIRSGNLVIGTDDEDGAADFTIKAGSVEQAANVMLSEGSKLNIQGGKVSLDSADQYNGDVEMIDGILNLASGFSKTTTDKSTYKQSGGTLNVDNSSLTLNTRESAITGGVVNVKNSGTVNFNNTLANSVEVNAENANIGIGKNTSFELNKGGIDKSSVLTVEETGTFTLNNDDLELILDSEDKVDGNLDLKAGTITMTDGFEKVTTRDGKYTQSSGTLNIDNAKLSLNDENSIISDGIVNVRNAGTLNFNNTKENSVELHSENSNIGIGRSTSFELNKGDIDKASVLTVDETGTFILNNDTIELTLDSRDKIDGNLDLKAGTITMTDGFEKTTTDKGQYTQSSGTLNIKNAKLALNEAGSVITDGAVNVSDDGFLIVNNGKTNASSLDVQKSKFTLKGNSTYQSQGGTIDKASEVKIDAGSKLVINSENSNVKLDGKNDVVDGSIELNDGMLYISDNLTKVTDSNGTYVQTNGTLNLTSGSKLEIADADSEITGGTVDVNDQASLVVNNGKKHTSRLNITGSRFALRGNSTYETTGGKIDKESEVSIASKSRLKINSSDASVALDGSSDNVEGTIELNDGTLYISDNLVKVTDSNGRYIQTGGKMTLDSSRLELAHDGSKISGGTVNLTNNSALTVTDKGGDIRGGNLVIDDTSTLNYLAKKGLGVNLIPDPSAISNPVNISTSGLINMVNNAATESKIDNLVINNATGDGQADFAIDVIARGTSKASADRIIANSIKVEQSGEKGVINISDWNLYGDSSGYNVPIEKNIRLGKLFDSNNIDSEVTFTATDKEVFTPVGYYRMNASSANDGSYDLNLTRFNPQVFRGQVATAATFMNQLVVTDTLFNRAQIRRYGASYDEMFKNRTAILDGTASYERTIRDGAIWTEAFGNFETLKMSQGLSKVRNNSWGFIVGGDFGLKDLSNGWKWMPTAYLAYNGGRQTFNGVGMYENGAQLGFMSTFSRQNLVETAMIYGGFYGTDMSVAGHSDDAFNYFFGAASRTAYDWKVNYNFTVQPNLTLAYNLFGKQNWHSDFGQMGMSSGFLNGLNTSAGVNFIWQHEDWNMYAGLAYAWTFFGGIDGSAGNIDLPSVKMRQGYLTWTLGMTKTFTDRFMMYGQATIRNIGRSGIVCQGGLNWRL